MVRTPPCVVLFAALVAAPVREAATGDVIQAGVVYVAPPGSHLVLRGGGLVLTDTALVHFVRPSVDVLFASVAADCLSRAVGVIIMNQGNTAGADRQDVGVFTLRATNESGIPAVFLLRTLIPFFALLMALQGVAQAIRALDVLRTHAAR